MIGQAIAELGIYWGSSSYICTRRAADIETDEARHPKQIPGKIRRYTQVYYGGATAWRFCSIAFLVGGLLKASV